MKKIKSFNKNSLHTRSSYAAKKGIFTSRKHTTDSSEKYQAVCNECHSACEVPFRPNGKKPVYCSNCFKGKEDTFSYKGATSRGTSLKKDDPAQDNLKRQFTILNTKLDKLVEVIETQNRLLSQAQAQSQAQRI